MSRVVTRHLAKRMAGRERDRLKRAQQAINMGNRVDPEVRMDAAQELAAVGVAPTELLAVEAARYRLRRWAVVGS